MLDNILDEMIMACQERVSLSTPGWAKFHPILVAVTAILPDTVLCLKTIPHTERNDNYRILLYKWSPSSRLDYSRHTLDLQSAITFSNRSRIEACLEFTRISSQLTQERRIFSEYVIIWFEGQEESSGMSKNINFEYTDNIVDYMQLGRSK